MERSLNRNNVEAAISKYEASIEEIGETISDLRGVSLFQSLKRRPIGVGPYPHVTLFEAANRIMTDLVILKGVRFLLHSNALPFDEYIVEYGNEDANDHDISAEKSGQRLIAEAFNVAPSFFQGKKNAMRKKLRTSSVRADYMIILANSDAVPQDYAPKYLAKEYFVFVDLESGKGTVMPN
ncbi:hypothetical protein [Halofilum ochraceum]|uniref:hypothetical protein n=1 Tax=Halofilum ochraceum TaxID=1611323 RepID=UPI0008DAC549|nr:hypothetical protein [Halofilum ochraceum]